MNHQEMITHVSNELRNKNIDSLITGWLNLAIAELANNYTFGVLNKYGTKATVNGNPAVVLDADFDWLKTIGIPAERRKLWPENEERIAMAYPDYRTLVGTTTHYYLNGVTLGLYHVPDSVKTLSYSYQRLATPLSALTDTCEFSIGWHMVVVQKAKTLGFQYDGNTTEADRSYAKERLLLKACSAAEYARPDFSRNMGGSSTSPGKPPYPTLPWPRITVP